MYHRHVGVHDGQKGLISPGAGIIGGWEGGAKLKSTGELEVLLSVSP